MVWFHTHVHTPLPGARLALVHEVRQSLGLSGIGQPHFSNFLDIAPKAPVQTILAYDAALRSILPDMPFSLSLHLEHLDRAWTPPGPKIDNPYIHWINTQQIPSGAAVIVLPKGNDCNYSNAAIWPLYTQPIMHADNTLLYYEALLRSDVLRTPAVGTFDTGEFVQNLEASDRIEDLDNTLLKRVCAALKKDSSLSLGLNTSRKSLLSLKWQSLLRDQAPPALRHRLLIEITESMRLTPDQDQNLRESIKTLVKEGFRFVLDDLGKGTTTLRALVDLPLAYVKLDQDLTKRLVTLLQNPHTAPSTKALLQDLSDLGHQHGWTLIAEGIEQRTHMALLAGQNVQAFQGFAVERPQPSPY